jgi:glycosyltransferase involved in cell wall biosynthesis
VPRGLNATTLALNYLSFALSAITIGAWKLRGQSFDLVFVFQLSPVTVGIAGANFRWLKRAPMVMWVLDLWPESLVSVGAVKSKWILKLVRFLVSAIYKKCDLILAQSRSFVPRIYETASAPDHKVEYFPSWAEVVFDDGKNDQLAAELSNPHACFTIMFAGNLGVAQDLPAILDAAETLKGNSKVRWIIVGDGRMGQWLSTEILKRGLSTCVQMLGRFPVERMPSMYKCADALLVSLRDEPIFAMTIPGKMQSYLAAGIPVLAMLNGEGADVLKACRAGIATPAGDGKALARAVLEMIAMPKEDRDAMGANGVAYYRKEFERSELLSRLEKRFCQLIKHNLTADCGK